MYPRQDAAAAEARQIGIHHVGLQLVTRLYSSDSFTTAYNNGPHAAAAAANEVKSSLQGADSNYNNTNTSAVAPPNEQVIQQQIMTFCQKCHHEVVQAFCGIPNHQQHAGNQSSSTYASRQLIYQRIRKELNFNRYHFSSSRQQHRYTNIMKQTIDKYLELNHWRDFNEELRHLFVKEMQHLWAHQKGGHHESTANKGEVINQLKQWSQKWRVPYEKVYRLFHYQAFGKEMERSKRRQLSRGKSYPIVTSAQLRYFLEYIHYPDMLKAVSRGEQNPQKYLTRLTQKDRHHLMDKLGWTPQQLKRRVLYYSKPQGIVTREKVNFLKNWLLERNTLREGDKSSVSAAAKRIPQKDVLSLANQLHLSSIQVRDLVRHISASVPRVTQKKREHILTQYEAYCRNHQSSTSSTGPSVDQTLPAPLLHIDINHALLSELSTDTGLQKSQILRIIDQHRKQPCTTEQKQAIVNYLKKHNYERPVAHEVRQLSKETQLTHRQVYHYVEQILDPPGEWNQEKKQQVYQALLGDGKFQQQSAGGRHSLVGSQVAALAKELQLSRKQIRNYVQYQIRKLSAAEEVSDANASDQIQ